MHEQSQIDVAIVGAGPVGIELAVACMRAGLSYRVLEAGQLGNTMAWWAPGTRWFSSNDRISIAGVPLETPDQSKATREQYLTYLRSVVRQFSIHIDTHCLVKSIVRHAGDQLRILTLHNGRSEFVTARYAVLAVGGTDFPNKLNVPGEDLPHVDSYFREPHRYFQRKVLIIGGRNSAVEAAIRAVHCGADVSISYRAMDFPRESIKYWLLPEIDGLIRAGVVKAFFGTVPFEITSSVVRLKPVPDNTPTTSPIARDLIEVPVDDVLALVGYQQDKRLFEACGVELTGVQQAPVYDEHTMMTNVPGVFVAGTAIAGTQSSKYRIFLENCHQHAAKIIAR